MRRNFLPILGLLSLFVLGSCSAERDPKIASLKHAIGVADSQLLDAAAELDTTNCFPRSLMPRFRAVDAKDWTKNSLPKRRNTPAGWRVYNIIRGRTTWVSWSSAASASRCRRCMTGIRKR